MKLQSFALLAFFVAAATGHYVTQEDARSSHVGHHNDGRNNENHASAGGRHHARTNHGNVGTKNQFMRLL